jgi:hypothetical protein
MDMRTVTPSQWFTANDFDAVGTEVTIGNVMMQQVGAQFKPVIYFNGQDKGLVLNPTNNNLLMSMLGWESKEWTGKKIVLFAFTAMFQGQPQQRIGVRSADGKAPQAKPAKVPVAPPPPQDDPNDEIPF